jgi:hypothetical protein
MSLVPGHGQTLRLDTDRPEDLTEGPVRVEVAPDADDPSRDREVRNGQGLLLRVEHADGTITVSNDGGTLPETENTANPPDWFDNLCAKIDGMELGRIAELLIIGINDDITSRQDWIDQRVDGLKLLGLKLETPDTGDSADGAAVEGMSRVRHPMLLEAALLFQANARGEMLPVDGPVKIRDDNNNPELATDQLADALEKDFNHYLTKTAPEYYPDTDRMFFRVGFEGGSYKKIYFCPLRQRPVSETVDAEDLIVNESAISLGTAKRVTHRIMMRPSVVRRMQILGIYRDIPLNQPNAPVFDAMKQEQKDIEGVQPGTMRVEDRDREIYECYCELDIKGFEHKWKGQASGLDVPYRVTIDLTSRSVLSVVRNYDEDTKDLPVARETFVEYVFVPGLKFYPIGLLHIMGNLTNASTAAWRIMLDNGMFANFPGFLFSKGLGRQNSLIVRVPPGGGAGVDTNGMAIGDAILPLPYKSDGMAALMALNKDIVEQAQRVGQTSQIPVGEGRSEAPVGTTLAIIEQGQKLVNAVHKRMHSSQSRELQLIAKCFLENPDSFWQQNRKPAAQWDEQTFRKALADANLVPQSDPNTASHIQRLMKVVALMQLQATNQTLYDPLAVHTAALQAIGFTNPQQFFAPPSAQATPPPEMQQAMAELSIRKALADAKTITAQADAKKSGVEAQVMQQNAGLGQAKLQLQAKKDDTDDKVKIAKAQLDASLENKSLDNQTQKDLVAERVQLVDVAQNIAVHPESAHLVEPLVKPAFEDVNRRQAEHDAKMKGGLGGQQPPVGED